MSDMKDGVPGRVPDLAKFNKTLASVTSTSAFADLAKFNTAFASVAPARASATDPSKFGAVARLVSALDLDEKALEQRTDQVDDPMIPAEMEHAEHSETPTDDTSSGREVPGADSARLNAALCDSVQAEPEPPSAAENLLSYLLPPDQLEERLGDFEEGVHKRRRRR